MKNLILLLSDGSVVTRKKISKIDDSMIKYLLIKVDYEVSTYALLEYKRFMSNQSLKTIVCYESYIMYDNFSTDTIVSEDFSMGYNEIELYGIQDIVYFLYSLKKISFFNGIIKNNDSYISRSIRFSFFELKLILNDKEVMTININNFLQKGRFDPKEIFANKNFKKIVPIVDMNSNYLQINSDLLKWKISEENTKGCLIGISLPGTDSIIFMKKKELKMISLVRDIYCHSIIFEHNNLDSDPDMAHDYFDRGEEVLDSLSDVGLFEFWGVYLKNTIEFITYLPYLYLTYKTIVETQKPGNYGVKTFFEIRYQSPSFKLESFLSLTCTDEDPITIYSLLKKMVNHELDVEE